MQRAAVARRKVRVGSALHAESNPCAQAYQQPPLSDHGLKTGAALRQRSAALTGVETKHDPETPYQGAVLRAAPSHQRQRPAGH